ncbi:ABC transporter substrate-binding protein [Leisingera sp. S132]|uniref:ABC transporter substrate-binding protein n=1 Tax=Leisingera sp. S132 TaxID=2867016 RepID=UPI0021A693C0|nr:ABC transporter substrate-binding protein [Leisingera sp. S132]UWQ79866.1 ABC transporter substrate-binding protein [Leisingera sp. S132]
MTQIARDRAKRASACAVAAAALWAAATGAASAETLRIAVAADPGYLDPAYWGSSSEQLLIDNLYPRLAKYVPGDEWRAELDAAKSVDLSDPQHIAFELKPGIMWSGGYGELTAEDVEYSFERHLDPELESGVSAEFSLLEDVEVTGKYTGIIHLSAPSPSFWSATLSYTSGAIISKAAAEASDGYFEATPVATAGAYRFKSHEPGQAFMLERDPDWSGAAADFDEVAIIAIADDNAAKVAFDAGEIDYTYAASALEYDSWSKTSANSELRASLDPLWMGISETYDGLSDIRVRQAIQKAVDVPTILAAISNGRADHAAGMVAPGLLGYRDAAPMQRDVEGARALIAEAGAEGTVLRLDFVNTANRATIAQIVQANLAEIGLVVDLNGQDEGTFWSVDESRAADLQLHVKSWTGNPDGLYMMQYFTSDQVGVWNWEGLSNPEYDALVQKARTSTDDTERGKLYAQMQALMVDSGNFLFLTNEPLTILWNDKVVPATLPDGRPVFAGFKKAGS